MTSAVQIQYRRGTSTQIAAFTGAQGEMVVDTTNNRLVVQDGATAGGFAAAKLSEVVGTIQSSGGGTVAVSGTAVTLGEPGGMLNKFRNGTMDIWQRGTGPITVTTSGAYTADGWIVVPTGASVTAAQAGGRLTTKNSLQITGATSVTDLAVKQRIESFVAAAFCSQTVTVQAQVYNGTGGSITPALTVKHAGSQDVWSSPVTDVGAVNLQSCANGSWTQLAYAFAANAASYNGLEIGFDFGSSLGANTKSVQLTELDIRVTPGVAAGLVANPPPPELRPIGTEFAFAQRYYQVYSGLGVGLIINSSAAGGSFIFGTQMRSAPTLSGGAFAVGGGSAGTFASTGVTANGFGYYNSANNWTAGNTLALSVSASAEL